MRRILVVATVGLFALAGCGGGGDDGRLRGIDEAEWRTLLESGSSELDEVTITSETASDGPCLAILIYDPLEGSHAVTLTAIFRDGKARDLVTGSQLDVIDSSKSDCWRD